MLTVRTAASILGCNMKQIFEDAVRDFRPEADAGGHYRSFIKNGTVPPFVRAYLDVLERRLGIRRS